MKYVNVEKGFVVFMAVMFVMSMASAAFAQDDVDSPGMTDDSVNIVSNIRAQPVRSDTPMVVSNDVRMDNCVEFLSNNNLDDRPQITCARLLKQEMNCVELMKRKGVDDAVAMCGKMFAGTGVVATRATASNTGVDVSAPRGAILKRSDKASPKLHTFVEGLADDEVDMFARLSRAEQNKILNMDTDAGMKRIDDYELRPVKKSMLFKKREIAKSKVDTAKQRFEQAKNEYARVNNAYKENKKLFLQTKEKLKECEDVETDDCNVLRNQTQEHAKEYIINGAKMAIEHLNKIREKVEIAEGMDEESAAEIIADIDEAISELEAAIEKVENAETKEQVQEGARDVAKVWNRVKHAEKVHVAKVVHSGMWNIIKKSEQLEKRLEDARARIHDACVDADSIDTKITEFSEKIASAKDKFNESEELIEEAREMKTDDPDEAEIEAVKALVAEARELLRLAHEDVKDASKLLSGIIREIHACGGSMSSDIDEEGLASDEVYEIVDTAAEDDEDSGSPGENSNGGSGEDSSEDDNGNGDTETVTNTTG